MPAQDTPPPPHKPHDRYFEQVFKHLPVARQLLAHFLPAQQSAALDLESLELSAESFLTDELRESFADLAYTCRTAAGTPARVCLLLEHKSGPAGRQLYLQLAQYLRGVQEEDIRQRRKPFTLTVPVLFYHGKKRWQPKPLRAQYGPLPEPLSGYVPHFDICCVNVRDMRDEDIRALEGAMLLQKVLLAFKHAYDREFWLRNFREMFIFVGGNEADETVEGIFSATMYYFHSTTNFNEREMANLAETLPPAKGKKFVSTYDRIFGKGRQEGRQEGSEALLSAFLKKFPDWPDEQVAATFEVSLETVRRVRGMV